MSKTSKALHGAQKAAGFAVRRDGTLQPAVEVSLSKLLSVQRPMVLAYLRTMRRRNPSASPQELADIIGKHYRNVAMGSGAAVGAVAVFPGLGTTAALGVSAAETAGFLEASALYAQAMAELHGMTIVDRPRANALVLGLMLGKAGRKLVRQFSEDTGVAGQTNVERTGRAWASTVTQTIPSNLLNSLIKKMRDEMIKRYGTKTVGSTVGRILPFGLGAAVGIMVNRSMANVVIKSAAGAFGPMPGDFIAETDPRITSLREDRKSLSSLKKIGALIGRRRKTADDASAEPSMIDDIAAIEEAAEAEGADAALGAAEDGPRTHRS
ncbi:hypothetical protein [Brevibacterium sp. HMSC07C04]|uniref:hypothetical protein n=1 Tax=Brevibacterium sp. HMSC07C04 TaxID=1581130 RepID=UPI0008A2EBB4|nr:hypothetical protein [Brevibacterium sp. HMSC07C04]OFS25582.1 hypothetical protein HMPREF3162_08380 [Brevibacterium sp. HMSC07C04]